MKSLGLTRVRTTAFDSPLCLFGQPGITALSRDVVAYGAQTARTLIELVAGGDPSSVVVGPPTRSVRGSTGPAPR